MRSHYKIGTKPFYGQDRVWTWRDEAGIYWDNFLERCAVPLALLAIVAFFVGLLAVSNYGDKAKCSDTAELFGDTEFKYTMRLGCMVKHNGRWVSGESLRDNTVRIEKEDK